MGLNGTGIRLKTSSARDTAQKQTLLNKSFHIRLSQYGGEVELARKMIKDIVYNNILTETSEDIASTFHIKVKMKLVHEEDGYLVKVVTRVR